MSLFPQLSPGAVAVVTVAAIAMVVDLLRRRIPNVITLPAVCLGLVLGYRSGGWPGAGLSAAGAIVSPLLLVILHAGHRPGMGDLKLTAAVGSLLGPAAGGLAVLVSAAVGGILAIAWSLRPGTTTARMLGTFLVGIPFLERLYAGPEAENDGVPAGKIPIPYGLAIGLGSILTVSVLC